MAARTFTRMSALGAARVQLSGSFVPNGAATTVIGQKGNGYSVVHVAGTANYTVTFQDPYYDYDGVDLSIQGPAGTLYAAQIINELDPRVARQLQVQLFKAGSVAVDNADAGVRVHFAITMKNTSGNF